MFRSTVTAGRTLLSYSLLRPSVARPAVKSATRFLTTTTRKKSNFKSTSVKWALAGGIVYWYATSNVFADEPKYEPSTGDGNDDDDDRPPSLLPKGSLRSGGSTHEVSNTENNRLVTSGSASYPKNRGSPRDEAVGESYEPATHPRSPEELEEEAGQEGAFNPETGEINWDCPCLGGMASGPCGEEFKVAFSCFVFSTEDPKGVDCIDKFKGMQTCFQQHPEVYGSELNGDGDDDDSGDDLDLTGPSTNSPTNSDAGQGNGLATTDEINKPAPLDQPLSTKQAEGPPPSELKPAGSDTPERKIEASSPPSKLRAESDESEEAQKS